MAEDDIRRADFGGEGMDCIDRGRMSGFGERLPEQVFQLAWGLPADLVNSTCAEPSESQESMIAHGGHSAEHCAIAVEQRIRAAEQGGCKQQLQTDMAQERGRSKWQTQALECFSSKLRVCLRFVEGNLPGPSRRTCCMDW